VSLIKTSLAAGTAAAVSTRAKDAADRAKAAAAQAVPVGKRVGATAVHGARQGVQDARDWAAPLVEEAVHDAREWAAPVLEDAADAVTDTVAPKVSSALRTTARRIQPPKARRRRLLDWRWLLGVGAAAAAAGAAAAVAMRRRYASATAQAKDATESPEGGTTDSSGDTAMRSSEVNGRVTTPGTGS
jgi:hypothetical protein